MRRHSDRGGGSGGLRLAGMPVPRSRPRQYRSEVVVRFFYRPRRRWEPFQWRCTELHTSPYALLHKEGGGMNVIHVLRAIVRAGLVATLFILISVGVLAPARGRRRGFINARLFLRDCGTIAPMDPALFGEAGRVQG